MLLSTSWHAGCLRNVVEAGGLMAGSRRPTGCGPKNCPGETLNTPSLKDSQGGDPGMAMKKKAAKKKGTKKKAAKKKK